MAELGPGTDASSSNAEVPEGPDPNLHISKSTFHTYVPVFEALDPKFEVSDPKL